MKRSKRDARGKERVHSQVASENGVDFRFKKIGLLEIGELLEQSIKFNWNV